MVMTVLVRIRGIEATLVPLARRLADTGNKDIIPIKDSKSPAGPIAP